MKALNSAVVAAMLSGHSDGFMAPVRTSTVAIARSTVLKGKVSIDDLAPKEFQLEELEDKEESETEVWLNPDGTVTLGKTNGPLWKGYRGDWTQERLHVLSRHVNYKDYIFHRAHLYLHLNLQGKMRRT
jgi:hypothetical protein